LRPFLEILGKVARGLGEFCPAPCACGEKILIKIRGGIGEWGSVHHGLKAAEFFAPWIICILW
jgi:hypothetical protein